MLHTVGPYLNDEQKPQPKLLKSCYTSIFDLVLEHKIRTVGFHYLVNLLKVGICSIATGFYGFPHQWACEIAIESTLEFLMQHGDSVDKVIFVLFNKSAFDNYNNTLAKLFEIKAD